MGLCWEHVRGTCRACGGPSNGAEYCTTCEHEMDVMRWTARAEFRTRDWQMEREQELYEARREKIMRSTFLFHEAVEVLAEGLLGVVQALHGQMPEDPQRKLPFVRREKKCLTRRTSRGRFSEVQI